MRTKKAIYNSVAAITFQIILFITGIIIPKLFIMIYGSSLNGLRASISQFVNYLTVVEVGIGGAVVYSLYKPIADRDNNKINKVLSSGKQQYLQAGYFFIALIACLMVVYPLLIIDENVELYKTIGLILVLGMSIIINYFLTSKYTVLLQANQKQYIVSVYRIICSVINSILLISFFLNNIDIVLSYFVAGFTNLLLAFLIISYVKRNYPFVSFNDKPDSTTSKMRSDVMFHQISAMAVFNTPMILLTAFSSLSNLSVYSIYAMVIMGIVGIIASFTNSLSAAFGNIITRNDMKNLYKSYAEYEFIYYIIISIIYTCAVLLFLPFLNIYTKGITDVEYVVPGYAILFIIMGLLNSVKIPQSTIIIAAGHYKQTKNRAIIEALICIISSLILVQKYDIYGVLIGSIFGLIYRMVDIFYPNRILSISIKATIIRIIRMTVIIISFSFIGLYYLNVNPTSLWEWILNGLLLFIIITICTILLNILCEPKTARNFVKRFINKTN